MAGWGNREGPSAAISPRQSSSTEAGDTTRLLNIPSATRSRSHPLPDIHQEPADSGRLLSSSPGGTMALHSGIRVLDPGAASVRSGSALHVPRPPGSSPRSGNASQTIARLSPEPLSFPTEESSSLPSQTHASLLSPHMPSTYDPSRHMSRSISSNIEVATLSVGLSPEDERMKELVIHGINHFEQRNRELKDYNSRLLKEMEHLAKENQNLVNQIRKSLNKIEVLSERNDELKIERDAKEKEVVILKDEKEQFREQATQHWKAKVEIEEKLIKLTKETEEWKKKCDQSSEEALQRENINLKADLDKKNKEIKSMHKNIEELKKIQSKQQKKFSSDDDKIEFFNQLEKLKEENQKMKKKIEMDNKIKHDQEQQIQMLKERLDLQIVEYHHQRDLAKLKTKEFNELNQQKEHLQVAVSKKKEQLLSVSNQPNDTWPPRKKNGNKTPPSPPKKDETDGSNTVVVPLKKAQTRRPRPARRMSEGRLEAPVLPPLQDPSKR